MKQMQRKKPPAWHLTLPKKVVANADPMLYGTAVMNTFHKIKLGQGGHIFEEAGLPVGNKMYVRCVKCSIGAWHYFGKKKHLYVTDRFPKRLAKRCTTSGHPDREPRPDVNKIPPVFEQPKRIEITDLNAIGPDFRGISRGTVHKVRKPPTGIYDRRGVWIRGAEKKLIKLNFWEYKKYKKSDDAPIIMRKKPQEEEPISLKRKPAQVFKRKRS